ncbi:MAG: FadR family transcriptional regulator [Phycisphaerae bacterium]|jgi:GntR family transcriptional repressor for pyruvate dehydrogenase complex
MQPTATLNVFREMLANVHRGEWKIGSTIPSERTLINDFGVSRIAVREALSMLRGLGVLDIGHGRRTVVRRIDSETFGRLFPIMLSSGGQRTFDQIFDVRIVLESRSAFLAAGQRTEAECDHLRALCARFREQAGQGGEQALATDLEFHLTIARATRNPLYAILLEALMGFIAFAQRESCRNEPLRWQRAVLAHEAIAEAIAAGDAERARAEMEGHLRYSATRRLDRTAGPSAKSAS